MPRADPVERRLYQRAISLARTDVCKAHREEFEATRDEHYRRLLIEAGRSPD